MGDELKTKIKKTDEGRFYHVLNLPQHYYVNYRISDFTEDHQILNFQ